MKLSLYVTINKQSMNYNTICPIRMLEIIGYTYYGDVF